MGGARLPAGSRDPAFSLPPDDQAFREGSPMPPFDGRRTFGAPEYFTELTTGGF
jgi:hypothetical protein